MRPVLLAVLLMLPAAAAVDPIPAGTPFGTVYVRVVDCGNGNPVVGASVNLDNPTHRASGLTNATGIATLGVFDWFYNYYITASGYSISAGTRRFSLGEVFQACLNAEVAGFWRITATVQMWQGDVHAGGSGWALIRLRNFEPGVFNITEFQIWVSGYEGPAIVYPTPSGIILGKILDTAVNMTLIPKPDIPVGRLKADLRLKAVFRSDDGRVIGPLTIITDLDYVNILPYRTFRIRVLDNWATNPVAGATILLESTLPGVQASYTVQTDEDGFATIRRMQDMVYRLRVFYPSPYSEEVLMVRQSFPILVDLARTGFITTTLFEAHVRVSDLASRPLDAEVRLGSIARTAANGEVVFKNVPKGSYEVKCFWKGVEVCSERMTVDEPLVLRSPGGKLDVQADVGDLVLRLRKQGDKPLTKSVKLSITPFDETRETADIAVFSRLPRGEYTITVKTHNWVKQAEAEAGTYRFSIPRQHGEHTITVEVFDAVLRTVTEDGKQSPLTKILVDGMSVEGVSGVFTIEDITPGVYVVEALWLDHKVLDGRVELSPASAPVLTARIRDVQVRFVGVDGSSVPRGLAFLRVGGLNQTRDVQNGSVVFEQVPAGSHALTVFFDGSKVFEGRVETASPQNIVVETGMVLIVFRDQQGKPVKDLRVEVEGVGWAVVDDEGTVLLGPKPIGSYRFTATFKGLPAASGTASAGRATTITLPLHTLEVEVFDELDNQLQATIELLRQDVLVNRLEGSSASFSNLPPGAYTVRVSLGSKQVERSVVVQSDTSLKVIMPVALRLDGQTLSLFELTVFITPAALAAAAALTAFVVRKALLKRKGKRLKGRV